MNEDESGERSVGAYGNMERSDITPDFLDSAQDKAKNTLRNGEDAAAEKVAGAVINKVAPGAGAAISGVSKTSGAMEAAKNTEESGGGDVPKTDKKAKGKVSAKQAGVMVVIALIFVAFGVFIILAPIMMPFAIVARLTEEFNSTSTTATVMSDTMLDMQLAAGRGSSEYGETIYDGDEFGLSDVEKRSLAQFGIDYEESDDGETKALTYEGADGERVAVISTQTTSSTGSYMASKWSGGVSDAAGTGDEERLLAVKQEILDDLQIADITASNVITVDEALERKDFLDKYMKGARFWRDEIAGWFNSMTSTVYQRLGMSRNRYADWETTGNYEEDFEKFQEEASNKNVAEPDGETLEEKVEKIANEAGTEECAVMSAFIDIQGYVAAKEKSDQMNASSGYLEAIQKTQAGQGEKAPLNIYNNQMTTKAEDGKTAMEAEGMSWLFGSGKLEQNDEILLEVSTEANGGTTVTSSLGGLDEGQYRDCTYDNVVHDKKPGIVALIVSKIKQALSMFSKWLNGVPAGYAGVALEVLSPTIAKYNEAMDREYMTKDLGPALGDAVVSASQQTMVSKAKGMGQTAGGEDAVVAFLQVKDEVVAERAEWDRRNKSPFDTTSQNTFLGSIMYSLMPLAISLQSSSSMTSSLSEFSNLTSNSIASLLPTSSAKSIYDTLANKGDCTVSDNTIATSNSYCNPYELSDFSVAGMDVLALFEYVAKLRYDAGGADNDSHGYFYYNGQSDDTKYDGIDSRLIRDKALNPEEDGLPEKWGFSEGKLGDGTPNGCEVDWEYDEDAEWNPATNSYEDFYHFDQPVAWSYSRSTNFEYGGYVDGWPAHEVAAKNEKDPGECELDLSIDEDTKNPVINSNGMLGLYLLLHGQRDSNIGVADANNAEKLVLTDFYRGRTRTWEDAKEEFRALGEDDDNLRKIKSLEDAIKAIANIKKYSPYISGASFTMLKDGDLNRVGTEFTASEFTDETMGDDYYWNEMKYYQLYAEWQDMLESAGLLNKSGATLALEKYYEKNPLDMSEQGVIARLAGLSVEQVARIEDLFNYVAWLSQYDPAELYPAPAPVLDEAVYFEETQLIAAIYAIESRRVLFDDARQQNITA